MQRLFSGTPFDRPPTCERCGRLETKCSCPPVVVEPVRHPPEEQTARLRVERRAKGKTVTVVAGLDPLGNDLPALASRLKTRCGAGGTVKNGTIELQGNRLSAADAALRDLGYKTSRSLRPEFLRFREHNKDRRDRFIGPDCP